MKKFIFITFLFYFINLIQLSGFDLGIKLGLNSSSFIGDQVPQDVGSRLGMEYGASVGIDASESLFIHLGLTITNRGESRNKALYRKDDEKDIFIDTFNLDYKYHLNYLKSETLFNFTLIENNNIYFTGHTGLAFLGLLDATETVLNSYYLEYDKNVKDEHIGLIFGIPIGLSIKLKTISDRLYIGTQYSYGLTVVRKGVISSPDIRTEAYTLFIRYAVWD